MKKVIDWPQNPDMPVNIRSLLAAAAQADETKDPAMAAQAVATACAYIAGLPECQQRATSALLVAEMGMPLPDNPEPLPAEIGTVLAIMGPGAEIVAVRPNLVVGAPAILAPTPVLAPPEIGFVLKEQAYQTSKQRQASRLKR